MKTWKKAMQIPMVRVCLCAGIVLLIMFLIRRKFSLLLGMDDVGLRSIVSGIYTGTPEAHNFFMGYSLTAFLSALYKVMPSVYWYLIMLEVSNYGCMFLILYRVLSSADRNKIVWLLCAACFFLILWIQNLIYPEWTSTAAILSSTAAFWYATIPEHTDKKKVFAEYVIPVLLLFMAFNMRDNVVFMALPFCGIVFLMKNIRGKKLLKKEFLFLAGCIAVFLFSHSVNLLAYSSDEWKETKEFSNYRSTLFDRLQFPDYDQMEGLYQGKSISREMYDVMAEDYNFMLASKGVLTSENLKEPAEEAERQFYSRMSLRDRLLNCIKQRWNNRKEKDHSYFFYDFVFYTGMIFAIICAVKRKDKAKFFMELAVIVCFEAIWIYLYYGNYLPVHVGVSLYIIAIFVMVTFLWKDTALKKIIYDRRYLFILLTAAALTGGAANKKLYYVQQKYNADIKLAEVLQGIRQYCEEHADNVYFRDFQSFRFNELQDGTERSASNFIPSNGWTCILPFSNQHAPTDGKQELCSWISQNDHVYLIVREDRSKGVRSRQKDLFRSRGYSCKFVLEDELHFEGRHTVQIYHYVNKQR